MAAALVDDISPELETLDQLQGGDLPVATIRGLYASADAFVKGVSGLLASGDVKLAYNGAEVPKWQWATLLTAIRPKDGAFLTLTAQGAMRIA